MATNLAEIIEPTVTPDETGGVVVDFSPKPAINPALIDDKTNLATLMDEAELGKLYSELHEKVEEDETSRADWEKTAKKALKLLGLEIRDGGLSGAQVSEATDTLLLETLLMWQATALAETMPIGGPAKAVLRGDMPEGMPTQQRNLIDAAVKRAEDYLNDLLTHQHQGYVGQHDRMLFDLGLLGCGFKKVYPDPSHPSGFCIKLVHAEDMIVSYHADGVHGRMANRVRLSETQMADMVDAGIYLDVEGDGELVGTVSEVTEARDDAHGVSAETSTDEEYIVKELIDDLVLSVDPHPRGRSRPYMVVLDTTKSKIRAIYRHWRANDPTESRRRHIPAYNLLPGNSLIYGWGLAHMLGNTTAASQEALQAALTAAFFANHPAGFKNSGLSIREESKPLEPGEFRDVDSPTGNVGDSFAALPFKGPSPDLIALRQSLRDDGRALAGQASLNLSEQMTSNTPVGTALAALDEASRIPASIQRRVWHSLADELEIIREVLLEVMPDVVEYGDGKKVARQDIEIARFEPAMRPGAPTRQHRIVEAQTLLELSSQAPELYNKRDLHLYFHAAIGVEESERFMAPLPEEAQPADPVTEMANALAGKPLVAGMAQDHTSHITAHAAQMQMLMMQPALGEAAANASGALQAHIADHFSKQIMVAVAMQLGLPLEQLAQGMPPEMEMQIAPMVAQAMQQVLADMPQPPDPADAAIQIEQMKQAGLDRRQAAKTQADAARDKMKLASAEGQAAVKRDTTFKVEDVKANLAQQSNQIDVAMNNADNSTALAIAAMRDRRAALKPDPNQNPRPDFGR